MGFSSRSYAPRGFSSSFLPPGVKWLLISNTTVFVAYFLASQFGHASWFEWAALIPAQAILSLKFWQLATYMFLHSLGTFWHILLNMLTLYMFGADLERQWGTERFLKYYFLCGIGAGICVVIANFLFGNPNSATIGASGAIYGLLLAFGVLYPDRQLLFSFLFPIPAKYFVTILGAIAFLSTFGAGGGGVSHVAHLGGMLFGYAYLKAPRKAPLRPFDKARDGYRQWKLGRAKRKFEVYMRKNRER